MVKISTSIINEIVDKMRRAIGDHEEPYIYGNELLADYIADSIDELGLEWSHDYIVNRDIYIIEPEVDNHIQMLFVMKSKLLMLETQPDISFDTSELSVRRKNDNKKRLSQKINQVVNDIKMFETIGLTNTEYDQYLNSLKNWLYLVEK